MLSGLPTSLFTNSQQHTEASAMTDNLAHWEFSRLSSDSPNTNIDENLIKPVPEYVLNHTSPQVFHRMMTQLAQYGSSVLFLRRWMRGNQDVPLLQSLQFEVMERIRRFDDMISRMQSQYVEPGQDLVISLVEIESKVRSMVRPLLHVSDIINTLNMEPYAHAFRFLELLYDRTCESQIIGDEEVYEYLGTMFFDCFQVYIRQIRTWMEEGELSKNDHVFFISEDARSLDLAALWSSRYRLRKTSNGILHAPKFLHPATIKIFNTGKSVVVLKTLKKYNRKDWPSIIGEPTLSFQNVCGSISTYFSPFPELFDVAFDQWIESKHHMTSSTLRKCLFDECGLQDSLSALESIYFMVDGAVMSHFVDMLFDKLDSGKLNWNDRFTLTELAQGTIGSLPCVKTEMLRTAVAVMNRTDAQHFRKSVKALTTFTFTYNLLWPVQIVIAKETIPSYQRIFSFLLQIRRSMYMLQRVRIGKLQMFLSRLFGNIG
jgi:gamma-tubulin complex component 5